MATINMIKIVFFASLRERLGTGKVELSFDNQVNVAAIIEKLIETDERYSLLTEQDVLCAVNHTLCSKGKIIKDNDELAFFPPVTGG